MKLIILIGFVCFGLGLMTGLVWMAIDFDRWIKRNKKYNHE